MNVSNDDPATRRVVRTPTRRSLQVAVTMIALIGGFYVLREHWGNVAGSWPYLLLLACPLMHLMHGHGGQGDHTQRDAPGANPRSH